MRFQRTRRIALFHRAATPAGLRRHLKFATCRLRRQTASRTLPACLTRSNCRPPNVRPARTWRRPRRPCFASAASGLRSPAKGSTQIWLLVVPSPTLNNRNLPSADQSKRIPLCGVSLQQQFFLTGTVGGLAVEIVLAANAHVRNPLSIGRPHRGRTCPRSKSQASIHLPFAIVAPNVAINVASLGRQPSAIRRKPHRKQVGDFLACHADLLARAVVPRSLPGREPSGA